MSVDFPVPEGPEKTMGRAVVGSMGAMVWKEWGRQGRLSLSRKILGDLFDDVSLGQEDLISRLHEYLVLSLVYGQCSLSTHSEACGEIGDSKVGLFRGHPLSRLQAAATKST